MIEQKRKGKRNQNKLHIDVESVNIEPCVSTRYE